MDPVLSILLSWRFVFFGLAIAAVMYVFRLIAEYIAVLLKKDLTKSTLWNNLLLPILPVVLGAGSAFLLRLFPYPGFTVNSRGYVVAGDRIIFGLVAGLLSTLMYRMIKALMWQKIVGLAQNMQGNVQTTISVSNEQIPPGQISSRGQI